jgi:hypothetical protein
VDFCRDLPVTVEYEMDLSLKQQWLDVVLIRTGTEPLTRQLPDGFEPLAAHNLISFKSYQEALDGWALCELVGHYVNYRKQASPSMQDLLPESDFRLIAVSVRYPQALARQVALTPVGPGLYDVAVVGLTIRVVVVHELPQQEHNALLHLFSARADLVRYGAEHYRQRSDETSTLLGQLLRRYREEVALMPDALEQLKQFAAEYREEVREEVRKEVREEVRKEIVQELTPQKRLEGLSPDELLAALSPEMRAALAQRLKDQASRPNPDAPEAGSGSKK